MSDDAHNPFYTLSCGIRCKDRSMCGSARPRLSVPIIRQIRREQKAANGENRCKLLGAASLRNQMPFCHCVLPAIKEGRNSWS